MTADFEMNNLNGSHLLSLLARCRQLLEDTSIHERQTNRTVSDADPVFSASGESYDNFYILFVTLFYSFLAMALFKCFMGSDDNENKDPCEEFTENRTLDAGHTADKFYFEEESGEPF